VEEGDVIEIDINKGILAVNISEEEMRKRMKAWKPREPKITSGYLGRYAEMVTSASTGAVFES